MIPSDVAAQVRLLTEAGYLREGANAPVEQVARIRELQGQLSQFSPGERITAILQRILPDGSFRALVAGKEVTLALPELVKGGDALEQTAARGNPLLADVRGGAGSTGAQTPGQASAQAVALTTQFKAGDRLELIVSQSGPRVTFAQLAEPQAGGTQAALSSTGRLISFLLTGQPTPQPTAINQGQALLNAAPASGAALAPVLRQALGQSGLFYESHQARWIAGKVDTAALMREPQGLLGSPPRPGAALLPGQPGALGGGLATNLGANLGGNVGANLGAGVGLGASGQAGAPGSTAALAQEGRVSEVAALQRGSVAQGQAQLQAQGQTQAQESQELARQQAAQTAQSARVAGIPDRLLPIVHQQLDSLATNTYALNAQIWPGQNLEWEIEDPAERGHGGGEEADAWNTTLRLTLPRLGGVEARLHLTPAGVAMRLIAESPETAARMRAGQAELESALAAADLPLTGMVVEERRETEAPTETTSEASIVEKFSPHPEAATDAERKQGQ